MWWIVAAILSAVFAGLTAILSKCGVKNANSDVATAVRTSVVLVMAWLIVFITGGGVLHNSADKRYFVDIPHPFGPGDGRLVAVLLLCHTAGTGERGHAHRQAEHIDNSALLYHRVQGKAVLEGLDRPGVADNRYGVHGRIYLDIIKL